MPDSAIELLVGKGFTPAEVIDYLSVEERGYTQTEWAEIRGISQSSVSENVSKAHEKLEANIPDHVLAQHRQRLSDGE